MTWIKSILALGTSIMILGLLQTNTVMAEPQGFSVAPILSSNQNKKISNYFDLKVEPDMEQTLEIKITNLMDKDQTYQLSVNTAATNDNGIIDYSLATFKKDASMKIDLSECIELSEKQVTLPKKSDKIVSMKLKVPNSQFDGVLLGGITVEPIVEEQTTGINNIFTRTLAIQLTENDNEVTPELSSGEVSVAQVNARNIAKMELRNISPKIITPVTAHVTIINNKNDKQMLEEKKEQLSFAPNTTFQLVTQWQKTLKAGEYTYHVRLTDDNNNEWKFKKEFKIDKEEASSLNKTSVDKKEDMFNLKHIMLVMSAVIVFLFIVIIIQNRRNKIKGKKK